MSRCAAVPRVFWQEWKLDSSLIDPDFDYESLVWSPWPGRSSGVHCFTEDWRFESVWRRPESSLRHALGAECVIGPDFSVYRSMLALQAVVWQIYRSHQVTAYWQANGVRVVPCITWRSVDQIVATSWLYPVGIRVIAVRSPGADYVDGWMAGAGMVRDLMNPDLVLHFGTRSGIEVWDRAINLRLRGGR